MEYLNLKFTISYDGSLFQGSQKQPNEKSVEDQLIKAFSKLNFNAKIILSGRTDKEVHATGQVFNCLVPKHFEDLEKLKNLLNKYLPNSIMIRFITKVSLDFHARFHAKKRVYRYLLTTKKTNPFNDKYLTYIESINEELIQEAAKEFVGIFDFKYFHKTGSDKENTTREIYDVKFYKYKDIYVLRFCANSYLRSQIRLMVGFLLNISIGKLTIDDLKKQLRLQKNIFKTPAKANGLYLAKIKY